MGDAMDQIYNRYLVMALHAARLMQKAYNFENDRNVAIVKTYYSGVTRGLLAADSLLADIESFTDPPLKSVQILEQFSSGWAIQNIAQSWAKKDLLGSKSLLPTLVNGRTGSNLSRSSVNSSTVPGIGGWLTAVS